MLNSDMVLTAIYSVKAEIIRQKLALDGFQRLVIDPSAAQIDQTNAIQTEIDKLNETLSSYLLKWVEVTGQESIPDESEPGVEHRIIIEARLGERINLEKP